MVTNDSEKRSANEKENESDDKPLTEEERQKLFEAAKSAMTRTS